MSKWEPVDVVTLVTLAVLALIVIAMTWGPK